MKAQREAGYDERLSDIPKARVALIVMPGHLGRFTCLTEKVVVIGSLIQCGGQLASVLG